MAIRVKTRRLRAELKSGEEVVIPAWVVESGKAGPRLLVTAAQHGNEVQGAEVIRRFVETTKTKLRCGKVFAVPLVNLPAVRERRPHIRMKPEQAYGDDRGHNMNRWWPGRPRGNDTARIPHAVYGAFGTEATHVLDLHCWEKHHAPAVLIREAPGLRALAGKLGERFVDIRPPSDRTLGGHFCATGRVGVTFEFSGQYTVEPDQVERGVRLVTNYAKAIGLLPGALQKGYSPVLYSDKCGTVEVTAPCTGLFAGVGLRPCDPIRKGALLGYLLSDVNLKCREIRAPRTGYLRSYGASRANCDVAMPGHHPYVTKDERVARITYRKKA